MPSDRARRPIVVAETPAFAAWSDEIWTVSEKGAFIDHIATHPDAGVIIPGGSGLRKIRWRMANRGKRGGVRVVYYFHDESRPLLLIAGYDKAVQSDLSQMQKASIRDLVQSLKLAYRSSR